MIRQRSHSEPIIYGDGGQHHEQPDFGGHTFAPEQYREGGALQDDPVPPEPAQPPQTETVLEEFEAGFTKQVLIYFILRDHFPIVLALSSSKIYFLIITKQIRNKAPPNLRKRIVEDAWD